MNVSNYVHEKEIERLSSRNQSISETCFCSPSLHATLSFPSLPQIPSYKEARGRVSLQPQHCVDLGFADVAAELRVPSYGVVGSQGGGDGAASARRFLACVRGINTSQTHTATRRARTAGWLAAWDVRVQVKARR